MKRTYLILTIQTLACSVFITSMVFAQATVINRATQILTNGTVYNIQNKISNKRMDVRGNSISAGTQIWQFDLNQSDAQKFTFVDAGNGAYYILTKSNLYVTIKFNGQLNPGGATGGVVASSYILVQDNKYTNSLTACVSPISSSCPNNQKWRLIPVPNDNRAFIIQSVAFSSNVLQPVDNNSSSGIAMVVGNNTDNQKWIISEPNDLFNYPFATQEEINEFNNIKNNQLGVGVLGGETTKPFYYHHNDQGGFFSSPEIVYKYKKQVHDPITHLVKGVVDSWFPVEDRKKTICGVVADYHKCDEDFWHDGTVNLDIDANLFIRPDAVFSGMLKNPRMESYAYDQYYKQRLGIYNSLAQYTLLPITEKQKRAKADAEKLLLENKWTKIECEFTPDYMSKTTPTNALLNFDLTGTFLKMGANTEKACAFGPWMWERLLYNDWPVLGTFGKDSYFNNEIHPVNQIWFKKGTQTTLIALVDKSGLFDKTGHGEVEASGLNQRMSFYVAFEIPYSQLNSAVSLTQYQNMMNYNINGVAEDFTLTPINNVQQEILVLKYKGYDILRVDDNSLVRLQKTHRVSFDKVRKTPNGSIQGYIVVETEPMTRAGGSINIVVTNN